MTAVASWLFSEVLHYVKNAQFVEIQDIWVIWGIDSVNKNLSSCCYNFTNVFLTGVLKVLSIEYKRLKEMRNNV